MFESLNKKSTVMEGINTEDMKFHKLKDFVNSTIEVKGFFFTTSEIGGEQVVVVTSDCLVNMPKRAVEQFHQIRDNDEMLNAVLQGKLSIEVGEMVKTKSGTATVLYKLVG